MNVVVDVNLSPPWAETIRSAGIEAVHWSNVGKVTAKDSEVLAWAAAHGHVLFTHDLDFAAIIAATGERGPSVIQLRSESVAPQELSAMVIESMRRVTEQLAAGAIVTIEPMRFRVRLLPLRPG